MPGQTGLRDKRDHRSNWSQKGTTGDQGIQGVTGDTGPTGPTGAKGTNRRNRALQVHGPLGPSELEMAKMVLQAKQCHRQTGATGLEVKEQQEIRVYRESRVYTGDNRSYGEPHRVQRQEPQEINTGNPNRRHGSQEPQVLEPQEQQEM